MKPRTRTESFRKLPLALLCLAALAAAARADDMPKTIEGKAILAHPAGKAVLEAGRLVAAGKLAEVRSKSTKETRDEWNAMKPAEQKAETARQQAKTPDMKKFEADIAASGTLTIYGDSATLRTESPAGDVTAMAFVSLEGGKWLVTGGPMAFDPPPVETAPAVEGAAILQHEIGKLALEFSKRLASGKFDSTLELFSSTARANRDALPADERKESDAYYRKTVPAPADLAAKIREGGHLNFFGDKATLMIVTNVQTKNPDGSMSFTSESTGLGFEKENGKWRIGQ
ncbi:MAG: hypothetical protein AB7G12_17300 [Thermoanaerobaculia bacterium]